jgi:hypothetical protein
VIEWVGETKNWSICLLLFVYFSDRTSFSSVCCLQRKINRSILSAPRKYLFFLGSRCALNVKCLYYIRRELRINDEKKKFLLVLVENWKQKYNWFCDKHHRFLQIEICIYLIVYRRIEIITLQLGTKFNINWLIYAGALFSIVKKYL